MNRIYSFLCILILILFVSPCQAQIAVTCNDNANQLVNFLVNGVSFENATVSGFDCSTALFDGSASNISLESGVLMATGGAESAIPPGLGFGFGGGSGFDADLTEQLEIVGASNTSLNNLIILEFDFTPTSDQVSFEYVFASNEYPNYTCSQYNDIFGFFLSGPGINGPFSNNAINIALVPENIDQTSFTQTPVIVNTINSGSATSIEGAGPCDLIDSNWQDYSVFFTDNSLSTSVSFPGFTVPLIATASVIPCETYHIKLAIADVADGALSSAVFLLANSFSSVGLDINQGSDYLPYIGNDSTLVEGCMNGEIIFEIEQEINTNFVIDYLISGTAESSIDFIDIGTQVVIPAGETQVSVPIIPLYDGVVEGTETLIISTASFDGCNEQLVDYTFNFVDRTELFLDMPSDTGFCPGDDAILIDPYFSGGIYPLTYEWNYEGGLYSNEEQISIYPENLGTYTFSAIDLCDSEVSSEILTYNLEPENPLIASTTYNDIEFCLDDEVSTEVFISGGIGDYQIEWFLDGFLYSNSMNFDIPTDVSYEYNFELEVTDACSNIASQSININVLDCFVPNVFSPNNDGVNDYWYLDVGDGISNVRVDIYNRWGQLVYTSINYELCDEATGYYCWDGKDISENKPCPNGTYYYTIEFFDGRKQKGFFNLFR